VAAFPDAVTFAAPKSPGMSTEFAEALRKFCETLEW
jgi:hypothetical protein